MFERSEMDPSDRLWSLIAIPCSWLAVAAAQAGIASAVDWVLAIVVAGFAASFVPLFPVFVAIWSGRVDQIAASLAGRPMAIGFVIPIMALGLFDERVAVFTGFLVFFVGATQLLGVLIQRRTIVLDRFATVVGSAAGIAGFWLGWWNDVSPVGMSLLFFVYGFGVSTAAFTWIKTSTIDPVAASE